MRTHLTLIVVAALGALAIVVSGCGGDEASSAAAAPKPAVCPQPARGEWQKLANEIDAPVFCPSFMPWPLQGKWSGRYFNGRSVDPDRSYLVSWVWFETAAGVIQEVHVNLRGYPGTAKIPTCEDTTTVGATTVDKMVPCFSDKQGVKRLGKIKATVYTANQGADAWHVLYAWHANGSLYTLSQHVASPYTYRQVISAMDRMTRRLVRIEPAT